jgi:predicted dehydrogenase/threonine dehydrogenase-like Zn-dependent dehydrogenase
MLHVLQSLRTGVTELAHVPVPKVSDSSIVVETRASVVSPGTERMLVEFGRSGWIAKARSQPDRVNQALNKMLTDGVISTVEAVRAKLDTPIPLGYCQAGIVREVGGMVVAFAPGDRVVTNGPHAEYVRVPQTLAAKIPAGVPFEAAAFAPLAAIGLQGFRLAAPTLGETVVVYGLGPIGLLTVQIARAAGCVVLAIDRDPARCTLAEQFGATPILADEQHDVVTSVLELTGGMGADAVLLTLSTDADDPVSNSANMSRKRGRIVLVGVTGLNLRRDDFYKKELSFQVSCSYGPGRYDASHEEGGIDYPLAYVRWTEARNFAAVLELMSDGRLDPLPLITHRFPIGEAGKAYDQLSHTGASLGVVLAYEGKTETIPDDGRTVVRHKADPISGSANVAVIGAGNFATRVLIPAFRKAGVTLDTVSSSGGVSASIAGQRHDFRRVTSDAGSALTDPSIDTVVIATRHDSHATLASRALTAGKHVFVEKPLALTIPELRTVADALETSRGLLCVGFNRRCAPHVSRAKNALKSRAGPMVISITVNAGNLPLDHWTRDQRVGGGRIVGEACHFIDLCRFLAGAPITELKIATARGTNGNVIDDIALLQLSFADGSLGTIQYFSNGSKAVPKERVELAFDGKTIRLDNFRTVAAWGVPGVAVRWPQSQDKGHDALVAAFVEATRSVSSPPIPYSELLEVGFFSIEAERLAREGGGVVTAGEFGAQIRSQ